MKRLISAVTAFLLIFSHMSASASSEVSEWAKAHYEYLSNRGAELNTDESADPKAVIKRLQFAEIMYDAYKIYTQEEVNTFGVAPFYDTASPAAAALYVLGIVTGDENENFNPRASLTRQEAAKMLYSFYYVMKEERLEKDTDALACFDDYEDIAEWAQNAVSALAACGIMNGKGDDKFCPSDSLTTEEAVVLISRAMQFDREKAAETNDLEDSGTIIEGKPETTEGQTASVSWEELSDAEKYYVKIVEYRNTTHGDEMGAKDPVTYVVEEKELTFNTKPVRRYEITITAGDETKELELSTSQIKPWSENLAEIEAFTLPTTKEEADLLMEEITVDIWTLANNQKIASTATLTVHKAIAEKVKAVFKEIFEGEEKFPINSVGAYAWRGGKSEHNYGTAIDINPNENYCIYTDGTIVGSFYKPYENPYSITPFGEVVEIFEKYGFNWGGDTWSGNRDYMHFSYCGT